MSPKIHRPSSPVARFSDSASKSAADNSPLRTAPTQGSAPAQVEGPALRSVTARSDTAASAQAAAALGGNAGTLSSVSRAEVELRSEGGRGPKGPPEGPVSALLTQYGVDGRLGRPRERLVKHIASLQAGLAGETDPDKLLDKVVAENLRLGLFYLEGSLRLYRDRYGTPIEDAYAEVKALEDKLGAYSAAQGFLRLAQDKGLPAAVVTSLEDEVATTRTALRDTIAKRWTPSADAPDEVPAIRELVSTLASLRWDDYKDDRKYLVGELRKELKDLDKSDLDMRQLQGNEGLHELRRQLRWVPIYLVALDGMVALDDKHHPIKEYRALLHAPVAQSKYAQLPASSREKDPIELSRTLFLATTQAIEDLGAIKDRGEAIEGMAHGLQHAGLASSYEEAEAQAMEALGLPEDAMAQVYDDAERLYAELRDHGLLRAVRKDLKDD